MAWMLTFWNSSQALGVAFRVLTVFTITSSILIFVVKNRQETLSAKKARAQSFFIAEQTDKIVKQEYNISKLSTQAQESQEKADLLAKQAVNAERNIADTYDLNGGHRIRQGGKIIMIVGRETEVFRQMSALQQSRSWDKLLSVVQAQLIATPTWLSPYMFAAVAARELGDVSKARRLFTHVVQRAGDDPDYSNARQLLSSLPDQAQ